VACAVSRATIRQRPCSAGGSVSVLPIVLVVGGVAALARGLVMARRLARWEPTVWSNLTEYKPGPDMLDWTLTVLLVVTGIAAVVVAVVL
jgi:hypothetical protein